MRERNFTEKDSLELISQMIGQSRKNMEVGSGNLLLYYGYTAVVLSVVVYVLVHTTHNHTWASLWFLMFVPSVLIGFKRRKSRPVVVTHLDKAISSTWSILGWLFFITACGILVIGSVVGACNFALMLPLSLLYAGIGVSVMGVITEFKLMVYTPLAAFVVAIYMLVLLASGALAADWWNLLFGASFLLMMVVPGHLLNRKIKVSCLKN